MNYKIKSSDDFSITKNLLIDQSVSTTLMDTQCFNLDRANSSLPSSLSSIFLISYI